MTSKSFRILIVLACVSSLACICVTQGLPGINASGNFSATATSPASVMLEWQAVAGASAYKLEVQYGSSEFLTVTNLPSEQNTFVHFVVPGSTQVMYRLTATTSAGDEVIGTAEVAIPEGKPNPLVVQSQPALPAALSELQNLPTGEPTFDPNNFDPNNFDPSQLLPPGFDPSDLTNLDPDALMMEMMMVQVVGQQGGEVILTGPDGVIYTLTIPANALDQDVTFRLIPIGGLTGLSMSGGLLGAVSIAPQIEFKLPATLAIQFPDSKPIPASGHTVGLTVASFSNELSLYPAAPKEARSFSMLIDWGDTFGIANGTVEEVQAQAGRVPTDSGAQMAQVIAASQSQSSVTGTEADALLRDQLLLGILERVNDIQVSVPAPAGVSNNVYEVSAPLAPSNSAERQGTLAGLELQQSIAQAQQSWQNTRGGTSQTALLLRTALIAKIKAFIKKAQENCLSADAMQATYLIRKLNEGGSWGDPSSNFWAWLAAEYGEIEELKGCNFQLEITSNMSMTSPTWSVTDDGSTPRPIPMEVSYRENTFFLDGKGPVRTNKISISTQGCGTIDESPVPLLFFSFRITAAFDGESLTDFVMDSIEYTQERTVPVVSGCGEAVSLKVPLDLWGAQFLEMRTNPGGTIKDWQSDNGFAAGAPNVFHRDFDGFSGQTYVGPTIENTKLTLRVTPK